MGLAARIRALREAKGWSQAELARRLGKRGGQGEISTWETGKVVPETANVERLAEAFGVTVYDLTVDAPLTADFLRGYSAGLAAARDAVKALTLPEPSAEDVGAHSDAATAFAAEAEPPPGARPKTNGGAEGSSGPTSGPRANESAGGA